MLKEFKEFAIKGNMVDMAVGIVIGAAFTSIVNSLVNDIIMPFVGFLTGGIDFSNIFVNLGDGEYASLKAAQDAGAPTINIGLFINACISFLIVSFVLFIIIKNINRLKNEADKDDAEAPEPPRQEVLLEEIRDAIRKSRFFTFDAIPALSDKFGRAFLTILSGWLGRQDSNLRSSVPKTAALPAKLRPNDAVSIPGS